MKKQMQVRVSSELMLQNFLAKNYSPKNFTVGRMIWESLQLFCCHREPTCIVRVSMHQ